MKIGSDFFIDGEKVRQNERYILWDNRILKNLTVSNTRLHKGMATNGHSHEGLEEVYIFTLGQGVMQVDKELIAVKAGDIVSIPAGSFHKVCAGADTALQFVAIFQAYNRDQLTPNPQA
jgi:quercetin dioxygenase-like cupin family protein